MLVTLLAGLKLTVGNLHLLERLVILSANRLDLDARELSEKIARWPVARRVALSDRLRLFYSATSGLPLDLDRRLIKARLAPGK